MLAVCLALVAAFLYALGTVLQQKADIEEADPAGVSAGFLARLVQRPVWLAGVASELVGFIVLAVALGIGRLVIVQPLQVLSVVAALPLGVWLTGQQVGRRQIFGAVTGHRRAGGVPGAQRPFGRPGRRARRATG